MGLVVVFALQDTSGFFNITLRGWSEISVSTYDPIRKEKKKKEGTLSISWTEGLTVQDHLQLLQEFLLIHDG